MGHEDGEAAVARGCQMMGVGNCLSTTASLSIEDVAAASPDCYRWFQLYVYKDHNKTKSLVLRAAEAGYSAIVLTVDLPVLGAYLCCVAFVRVFAHFFLFFVCAVFLSREPHVAQAHWL